MATKKTTVKVQQPPKPKFGEVGYEFNVLAKVIKVEPDNNQVYPVDIEINLGSFADTKWTSDGVIISYDTNKEFIDFVETLDPKLLKTRKQEELKKAQALVDKLTKELESFK
jgi:hypothetical protein